MRIRTIKPEFFKHDGVAALPPLTRILFIGLWSLADRDGILEDRPARIKVEILPYDECDTETMLDELQSAGFITRYSAGGFDLIEIPSFNRHQRISGKEAVSESRFQKRSDWEALGKQPGSTGEALGKQPGSTGEALGKQPGSTGEATETAGNGREGKRNGRERSDHGGCAEILDAWNSNAQKSKLPQCLLISDKRRTTLNARLADPFFAANWTAALDKIAASSFCRGNNERKWKASFDWFLQPDAVVKAMEGKYDDRKTEARADVKPAEERQRHTLDNGFYVQMSKAAWLESLKSGKCPFNENQSIAREQWELAYAAAR